MSRPIKIAIILIIFMLVIGVAHTAVVYTMKKRLVDGWTDIAKTKGITLNKENFKRELDKLNVFDLYKLVKFSNYLKAKKFPSALGMWPEIKPIVQDKTNLLNQVGIIQLLIGI